METAADRPVKVGVVGVGYLGAFHAEKYAAMPGVELAGLADLDEDRCARLARDGRTLTCTNYKDLIPKVDAVSVVVPTSEHFRVARDFLEQGKDVLIEKPMASSLEEADELNRLADLHGRLIQVGHLERFNPAVAALLQELTTPMFIEAHRLAPFRERGTDVDVVLDLMIHDLDIILSCVPSELTSVHAVGVPVVSPHVDIANARLCFSNGCVANVTASRISFKTMRKIRMFQPNAYLAVDCFDRTLTVFRRTPGPQEDDLPRISGHTQRFPDTDPLAEELKAFVHSVRTRTPPLVGGVEAREALRVSLEVADQISSALESRPVWALSSGDTVWKNPS